jgi:hypothetical protein
MLKGGFGTDFISSQNWLIFVFFSVGPVGEFFGVWCLSKSVGVVEMMIRFIDVDHRRLFACFTLL